MQGWWGGGGAAAGVCVCVCGGGRNDEEVAMRGATNGIEEKDTVYGGGKGRERARGRVSYGGTCNYGHVCTLNGRMKGRSTLVNGMWFRVQGNSVQRLRVEA